MVTVTHVAFLVLGVVLVAVDGQLLRRSGTTYLKAAHPDAPVADSVNQLVTVLFHLVALGVLALLSAVDLGLAGFEDVVVRTGILLLLLAAAHGVTIGALARLRARQQAGQLSEELTARTDERLHGSQLS
jgi:hypothetical protein